MEKDNEKYINLSVDKDIWRRVGQYAASSDNMKKEVVATALDKFLKEVGY